MKKRNRQPDPERLGIGIVEITNLRASGPAPHKVTATLTLQRPWPGGISQNRNGDLIVTQPINIGFEISDTTDYSFAGGPKFAGKGNANNGDKGDHDMPEKDYILKTVRSIQITNYWENHGGSHEYRWKYTLPLWCADGKLGNIDPDIENDETKRK